MDLREILLTRAMGGGSGSGGGGGSASIDVTASVGQTIVVEEVDANGKPTKWKAAEYQPRTHWTEETVVLPEATYDTVDEETGSFMLPNIWNEEDEVLTDTAPDIEYVVKYNGTEYSCYWDAGCLLGNHPAIMETGDNGIPFVIVFENGTLFIVPLDGSASVTLSIVQKDCIPIPVEYMTNAFPYYIEVTAETVNATTTYSCNDTVAEITAIYNSGRSIVARVTDGADRHHYNLVTAAITAAGMVFVFTTPIFGSYVHRVLQFMPQADGAFAITVQEVKS